MAESAARPLDLFWLFSRLSLLGFGGVMPWMRRLLVDKRRMLTPEEFAEILALAQLLPGPAVCNMALIIGRRRAGPLGGWAALAGMVVLPGLLVVGLGVLYQEVGDQPRVQDALRGMSVAAAALVASMAVTMARALPRRVRPVLLAAAMFIGVGVLHWPLVAVMGVLFAVSVAWVVAEGPR